MSHTPPSNRQLTEWRKLLQGKYRKRQQKFIAEGLRCVEQIINQKRIHVEAAVIQKDVDLPVSISNSGLPIFEVNSDEFESISDTETPQGILAICRIPEESAIDQMKIMGGLIVAFDAIQDPGNLGTMIRTASWFNVTGLIIGHGTVDPFHPKVVRSTAGATGALPYSKSNLADVFSDFESSGWNVAALDGGSDSISLKSAKPTIKDILIIGNEGNGVHPELMKGRKKIKIDGNADHVESLNAAVALSIALYHFSPNT
ncbi:TrmH family RNA methyltransferase [Rhodohalobacter halophilus]|uniref:TrmH family RNA methyltransferase n=1 Tax=Rhodohalobacter halophilus TaxID=1812810 RepID=UPI00083F60A5|nr:RNA methyltransferase [Rhodohalobacter halophilus]